MSSESPPLVHVAGDCAADLVAELSRRAFDARLYDGNRPEDVRFLLTHGLTEGAARSLRSLRLLQARGVGVDHVPLDALSETTQIASMRGVFASLVAEYTWSAVLVLWRNWPALLERFQTRQPQPFSSESLEGRTMLVLGAGEIGRRVLLTARTFGMRTVAVVRATRVDEAFDRSIALSEPGGVAALDDALGGADVLVVAAPLTTATRGLLTSARLARLPRTALVVAVSRGGIIDEQALAAMLSEGRLGGAILDVCEVEPVPESSALYQTPNLCLTPHIAGFTRREPTASLERFVENVARVTRGEPLLGAIDRVRGY